MTRERFEQIKALATDMASEIEWADFPLIAAEAGGREFRELLSCMAMDPNVHMLIGSVLGGMFRTLEPCFGSLPDHQEPELQAAGLVQSALKSVLIAIQPAVAVLCRENPLRAKFRRLVDPVIQAPPTVRVPSMEVQERRRAMGIAPIG
jgi:hypothetical protein